MMQDEIRQCDFCGSPFHPVRELQRFCTKDCHDSYYPQERKQALAVWREMQRRHQMIMEDDDEMEQRRE
jgi:hypothetical protein